MTDPADTPALSDETRLIHTGHDPHAFHGFVNPPVVHASTVLFETPDAFLSNQARYTYGRQGTPTSDALEAMLTGLEGAAGTKITPSGLAACTVACLSVLSAGDHILVVDTVYGPTRAFADGFLKRFGVEVSYYDPAVGDGIVDLFRPNTRALFLEAPGSLTFEMQDVPKIAALAKARGIVTLMDNTWATPLFFKPLAHGIDLSIQAATKYISGHSDTMIGTVAASAEVWPKLAATYRQLGLHTGPDDIYLAVRGLRTMAVRLARHQASGLEVARWLEARPEVARVRHPALPSDPGHALWKRDFTGACGLFAIELHPAPKEAVKAFLSALRLFGMGYSWGGFESLVTWPNPAQSRTATRWEGHGPLLRFHIGLEAPADLIADLDQGFAALAAAR